MRALVTINSDGDRKRLVAWVSNSPWGTRVEFKKPRRSLDQNSKMWACLTDIAGQVEWHGIKMTPDDWKLVFLDGLKREMRLVPNLDGNGFVNLGRSSSDLSKEEMTDLIELILMFGANHNVQFHDTETQAAA